MEAIAVALGAVNLLLITVLIVVVFRQSRGEGAQAVVREELQQQSVAIRQEQQSQRTELTQMLRSASDAQTAEFVREREARVTANRDLHEFIEKMRVSNEASLERVRETVGEKLQSTLKTSLEENAVKIQQLTEDNATKQSEMQKTLRDELEKLRVSNEAKLEKMRETVDEKLQGTLEKRLGESFSLVSERLEQVQKGLGEMQTLASDVGGLKRVLTNVKNRGGWGEVQLARQLEDMLTPEQYAENVAVRPDSAERVEFAVKLPGRSDDGEPVWLPVDSKFPQEDYERLVAAHEAGDKTLVDAASRNLERAIVTQAKLISEKYVAPPYTTDFGIMYLPTEGLFAEVVRQPGLTSRLQNEQRVLVTGPTTLMSLLNSLQLGFRTLAIEQRSSEVWKVLSAAKLEFQKYGQVWEKLGKQLQTAQNTVSEAGTRTRAVERRLRAVETLEIADSGDQIVDDAFPELTAHETGE